MLSSRMSERTSRVFWLRRPQEEWTGGADPAGGRGAADRAAEGHPHETPGGPAERARLRR